MRSFAKIKSSRNGKITLLFIDRELFTSQMCSFNAIRENKILARISESTVVWLSSVGVVFCPGRMIYLFVSFLVLHSGKFCLWRNSG